MTIRARMLGGVLTSVAVALGVLTAPPASAAGYSLNPNATQTWSANGAVFDIHTVRNRVYIAGNFSNVTNVDTGQRVARNRLAAFNRDSGALLSWNPGANNTVRALAVSADRRTVYAGGLFSTAGGASNSRIAALNRRTGLSVAGFRASANNEVRDLLVMGGSLFAAGAFRTVNGVSRRAVAKLDGDSGDVVAGFNARVGTARVFALGKSGDGRLVIGGNFQRLAGSSQRYLAAVSPDNGNASPWSPVAICDRCLVLDVAIEGGVVYTAVGGPGGGRGAAWTLDNNNRKWSRGADGDVQAVDVEDGLVYFGGHFGPRFFNTPAHQLVVLQASNGALQNRHVPFVGNDKPGIWAVDAAADYLRIGGYFQGIGSRGRAARYAVFDPQ